MITGSSLPIWSLVLIFGLLVNFVVGIVNPYVPKRFRIDLEKYQGDCFDGVEPGVPEYRHVSRFAYYCLTNIFVFLAAIFFFVETFADLIQMLHGRVFGTSISLAIFVVGAAAMTLLLMAAAVSGEALRDGLIKRYYLEHFRIRVIDKRDKIETEL